MGIRYLNRFLKKACGSSNLQSQRWQNVFPVISFEMLRGKTVAIDISIYLYKFQAKDALLENLFIMLTTFHHYNIVPIFVFDGKPPAEKLQTLQKRRDERECAYQCYAQLSEQLVNARSTPTLADVDSTVQTQRELLAEMNNLKKRMVRIGRSHVEKAKEIIRLFGATYLVAPNEADELCAALVVYGKAWACISDDTDLLVYGCTRVLRYFTLASHTAVLYEMDTILAELGMTLIEFKEFCVLLGTDYDSSSLGDPPATAAAAATDDLVEMKRVFQLWKQFQKFKKECGGSGSGGSGGSGGDEPHQPFAFSKWIGRSDAQVDELRRIYSMFVVSWNPNVITVTSAAPAMPAPVPEANVVVSSSSATLPMERLKKLLGAHRFLFVS